MPELTPFTNAPAVTDPPTGSLQKINALYYQNTPGALAVYAPQVTDDVTTSLQKINALVAQAGGGGGTVPGFVTKSAAYTLTGADSGKDFICSGGSWVLTLPAPAAGLWFQIRNDQGISGTTGTITLTPSGGTIDGAASSALLPQQECTLFTDGTNWRTFGLKREVILGTQDIIVSTAQGVILLPLGYRYFDLDWEGVLPVTNASYLLVSLSMDGGTTWLTGAGTYGYNQIYNSSAAALATAGGSTTGINTAATLGNPATQGGSHRMRLYPGSTTMMPRWSIQSGGYSTFEGQVLASGFYGGTLTGPVNALKYAMNAGNIANSFLTVKGIV